jgi:raffinose/stachyose/melibiose transport system substrate-binding protein
VQWTPVCENEIDKEFSMKGFVKFTFSLTLLSVFALTSLVVSAQEPITLTIWSISSPWATAVEEIAAEYEALHPNVDVAIENRTVDGHKEAMRVAINTAAAPDIYFMWGGEGLGGFYPPTGGVEPLDAYYEQYGWSERFTEGAISSGTFDDKIYGVPFTVHGMGLYYRKDLFEQAGITEEPQTYEELIAANDALVAAGITPLYSAGKFGWMPMRLVDSLLETFCGSETHDALTNLELNWAEEPCVEQTYTEYQRWVNSGYLPENFLGVDPTEPPVPLFQGNAAMTYEGTWFISQLNDAGEDLSNWDFFPFPTGTDRLSSFTELFFITSTSPHKDEAAAFLDFFTSPDVQQRYLGRFSVVSPTAGVEPAGETDSLSSSWLEALNTAPGIYLPGDQALPLEIVNSYFRVNDDVVAGVTPPTDAGAAIQTDIENYLAQEG